MNTDTERQLTRRFRTMRPRWTPGLSRDLVSNNLCLQHPGSSFALRAEKPLPPTRAARKPRSRGFFFKGTEPPKKQNGWRKAEMTIVALAIAVVAAAFTLIVGAPTMMGGAINLNPGPAIFGAASVPPAFIEPSRLR